MSGANVLILEDDQTQGEALKQALKRLGHTVTLTDRPEEARLALTQQSVQYFFVDCLLPGESGVDFVESIRKKFPAEVLSVILMSGVFTDPAFVKESLRSTRAVAFLKKPFELQEALALIPQQAFQADEEVPPRKALYQIMNRGKLTVREKRKIIEGLDEIHGFDLPFIYNLLVESKVSGHLNIAAHQTGEISGISFSQGVIVGVDIADQETYLGKLLIESGYILPEDLDEVLNLKSTKKIGERLIHGNLLSPHAFNIVLSSQMNIRLSRTIENLPVKINFVETDIEMTSPNIDGDALIGFLHDWIASKISLEWLKNHYVQWEHNPLVPGPHYTPDHPILKMRLVANLGGLLPSLMKGDSLSKVLEAHQFAEEPFYKALHLLLCKGVVFFGQVRTQLSAGEAEKMLNKMALKFQDKNMLEIFDYMSQVTNGTDSDPEKVYNDFMELVNMSSAPESAELRKQLEKKARDSYEFVKTGDREKLREEMAKKDFESKIKAASQFEEAKDQLQKLQFQLAYDKLQKALVIDPSLQKAKIYLAWAKSGLIEGGSKKFTVKDVEMDLVQVSPEDRFDAVYIFVTGMVQKISGDVAGARKAFEKSIAMDSSFVVARRELGKLAQGGRKDMMNRDLKDLVSDFFGKKK